MRYVVTLLVVFLSTLVFAQEEKERESTTPLYDIEVTRKVDFMIIEDKTYEDVTVKLKSISPDYILKDKFRVQVTLTNNKGKKIWKKTLKNVYLYMFSHGEIHVRNQHFLQLLILKNEEKNVYFGIINEKEGIIL